MYEIPDKMPEFISLVQGVLEADISFLCIISEVGVKFYSLH